MLSIKTLRRLRTATWMLAIGLLGSPTFATASEPSPVGERSRTTLTDVSRDRDATRPRTPTLSDKLREKLGHIPLRPVRIGTTPRLPDDPEPGMGLVLRIEF